MKRRVFYVAFVLLALFAMQPVLAQDKVITKEDKKVEKLTDKAEEAKDKIKPMRDDGKPMVEGQDKPKVRPGTPKDDDAKNDRYDSGREGGGRDDGGSSGNGKVDADPTAEKDGATRGIAKKDGNEGSGISLSEVSAERVKLAQQNKEKKEKDLESAVVSGEKKVMEAREKM